MSNEIKKIDAAQFLSESGLLFEINRKILHPLGLALEIICDDEGNPLALGDLWDYRNDPEGMLFTEDTFHNGIEKLEKFNREFAQKRRVARKQLLGFIEQGDFQEEREVKKIDVVSEEEAKKVLGLPVNISEESFSKKIIKMETPQEILARKSGKDYDVIQHKKEQSSMDKLGGIEAKGNNIQPTEDQETLKITVKNTKHYKPKKGGNNYLEECENPCITREKIPGGGSVEFCTTCGTQLRDTDLEKR